MNDSFAEAVDGLHESASRIVGRAEDGAVVELFAERSFREHLTLSYARRTTHGGPSELHDHEELAGASVRRLPGSDIQAIHSLHPADLTPFISEPRHLSTPELQGSLDLPADTAAATTLDEKRHLLQDAADAALSLDPSLQELDVSFQGVVRCIAVWASDIQPALSATSYAGLRVFASKGGAAAHAVGGAPGGIGRFLQESPASVARTCISRLHALEKVDQRREISGDMPVVLDAGWGGVWLHEAVGHLLEADTDARFGPTGTAIGSPLVTIIDDGTWAGGRGTSRFDDEGMPTQRTVLVERGVLKGFMTDRHTARQKSLPRTANGRRQDYRHPPIPRMTNLLLEKGESQPSDLVEDVEFGLYVRMIGSGEVRPANDHFHFDVVEGYIIERGELTSPVTALRISGKPSEMLRRVVGVGNDFSLEPARGTCMKAGQTVPVSVGTPTVLLDRLTIASLH